MTTRSDGDGTELDVLLVEDNPGDRTLIRTYLRRIDTALLPGEITLHECESLPAALSLVEDQSVDLVLLDLGLPNHTGIETFHALGEAAEDLPVVVLTGLDDETTAIEAIQSGAQDYLNKDDLDEATLARTIRYAIERTKRERVLREHKRQLEVLNHLVRHDIKNDLTLIRGPLKLIRDEEDLSPDSTRQLDNAISACRHVMDLIDTAGDFVEEIARGEETDLEPVALADVVREEVAKARETYPDAAIEMPDDPPACRVLADRMVASVVRNLVNNAVQHHDGGRPTVAVDLDADDDRVTLRVADDGPGIPETVTERVGDADATIRRGNGVGLQLVATLVDRYDGRLAFEETAAGGTAVTVTFPPIGSDAA